MSVRDAGRRLKITNGSITLTAFRDSEGQIAIANGVFGLRLPPEDLRTVLDELAPETRRDVGVVEATDNERAAPGRSSSALIASGDPASVASTTPTPGLGGAIL